MPIPLESLREGSQTSFSGIHAFEPHTQETDSIGFLNGQLQAAGLKPTIIATPEAHALFADDDTNLLQTPSQLTCEQVETLLFLAESFEQLEVGQLPTTISSKGEHNDSFKNVSLFAIGRIDLDNMNTGQVYAIGSDGAVYDVGYDR